jgi:hypothetical protein
MTLHIAAIVEGHGEQLCLSNLLHRIWGERLAAADLLRVVTPPLRKKRDQIIKEARLGDFVHEAVAELRQQAKGDATARLLVLILIDSEGACPADLATQLFGWANAVRPDDVNLACVLPHPMYETWFAAAASSLAGFNGMPGDLEVPAGHEDGQRGKGWVETRLRSVKRNRTYSETVDQPAFSRKMDLGLCHQSSRSFRKLCKELAAMLPPPPAAVEATPPTPEAPA